MTWQKKGDPELIVGKYLSSKPMCRIVQCLKLAIYPSKGDMNEAFTVLAIQERQTNFRLDRDDKYYKVTIHKRV